MRSGQIHRLTGNCLCCIGLYVPIPSYHIESHKMKSMFYCVSFPLLYHISLQINRNFDAGSQMRRPAAKPEWLRQHRWIRNIYNNWQICTTCRIQGIVYHLWKVSHIRWDCIAVNICCIMKCYPCERHTVFTILTRTMTTFCIILQTRFTCLFNQWQYPTTCVL